MNDITKCRGKDCLKKDNCYRYIIGASVFQSYFIDEPFELTVHGLIVCDYFIKEEEINELKKTNK